jgi:hypothetical protein
MSGGSTGFAGNIVGIERLSAQALLALVKGIVDALEGREGHLLAEQSA